MADRQQTAKQKSKKSRMSAERKDRFKWDEGDLKFFSSKEELEKQAKEQGQKITWY